MDVKEYVEFLRNLYETVAAGDVWRHVDEVEEGKGSPSGLADDDVHPATQEGS